MNYRERLNQFCDVYSEKLADYKKLTECDRYFEIVDNLPLWIPQIDNVHDMLEKLNSDEKEAVTFSCARQAATAYGNILDFKKNHARLLDDADYLMQVHEKAMEINNFLKDNPYLPQSLMLKERPCLTQAASHILRQTPACLSLITRKFRTNFTAACIRNLPETELDKLVMGTVIRADHLVDELHNLLLDGDGISETGGIRKLSYLKDILGTKNPEKPMPQPQPAQNQISMVLPHKLVGVSFTTRNRHPRQEILMDMQQRLLRGEELELKAMPYFFNRDGIMEPAIAVCWEGYDIGNISRNLAAEIDQRFENPVFEVKLQKITGGELPDGRQFTYGCEIELLVSGLEKLKEDDYEK